MDDSDIQSESDVPQNNDKNDVKRRSETWFFEIIVRLRHDRNFSDLLKAREHEQQIGSCLDSASDISWARSQTESETPGTPRLEGFVHDGSSNKITLNSLKRLLPEEEMTDAGEIIKTLFEEVKPGRGNNFKDCPKIRTFLKATTLNLLEGKRLRVDFRGSSEVCYGLETRAKTWIWKGSMRCSNAAHVESIFRSDLVAHRQKRTLGSASVIAFACSSSDVEVPGTMEVDLLVHSCEHIQLATLQSWLNPDNIPENVIICDHTIAVWPQHSRSFSGFSMIIYELPFQKITADAAFCARELTRTKQDKISEPRYKILRRVAVISTTPNLILNRHIDFVLAGMIQSSLANKNTRE